MEPSRKEPTVPKPERLLYEYYNIKETTQVIEGVIGRVYHSQAVEQGMQAWRLLTHSLAAGMRCLPGRLDRIACRWRSPLRQAAKIDTKHRFCSFKYVHDPTSLIRHHREVAAAANMPGTDGHELTYSSWAGILAVAVPAVVQSGTREIYCFECDTCPSD